MPTSEVAFNELADRVTTGLRRAFPTDTIDVRPGYRDRVHVLLVSRRLNGMTERQKQDLFWEIVRAELPSEVDAVSVAVLYGTDEL